MTRPLDISSRLTVVTTSTISVLPIPPEKLPHSCGDAFQTSIRQAPEPLLKTIEAFLSNPQKKLLLLNQVSDFAKKSKSPEPPSEEARFSVAAACRRLFTSPTWNYRQREQLISNYLDIIDSLPTHHPETLNEVLVGLATTDLEDVHSILYSRLEELNPLVLNSDQASTIDRFIEDVSARLAAAASISIDNPDLSALLSLFNFRRGCKPVLKNNFRLLEKLHVVHSKYFQTALSQNLLEIKPNVLRYIQIISQGVGTDLGPITGRIFDDLFKAIIQKVGEISEKVRDQHITQLFVLCDLMTVLKTYLSPEELFVLLPPEAIKAIQKDSIFLNNMLSDGDILSDTPHEVITAQFAALAACQEWFLIDNPFEIFSMAIRMNEIIHETTEVEDWLNAAQSILASLFPDIDFDNPTSTDEDELKISNENDLVKLCEALGNHLRLYDRAQSTETSDPEKMNFGLLKILYQPQQRWIDTLRSLLTQTYRGLIQTPDNRHQPVDLSPSEAEWDNTDHENSKTIFSRN